MIFYFIYFFISSFLFVLIHVSKFFNHKINNHVKNEKTTFKNVISKISKIDRNKVDILIFHAASAGEFEQIKPIIQRIDREKFYIIQTFTSSTIYNKEYNNNKEYQNLV